MIDSFALDISQGHIRDIDTAGELPLTSRRELKGILVERLSDDGSPLKFVGLLGLACAKQAWPVWRTAFPSESRPMNLAEAAVLGIKDGGAPAARLGSEFMAVKTYLDNKFLLGSEYFPAIYAGFACWAVARDVLSWAHARVVQGDSEREVSPEDWDPCFWASLAVTGGATWEAGEESGRRHEFWSWYLTVAVPEAFTAAADHPVTEARVPPSSQDTLF